MSLPCGPGEDGFDDAYRAAVEGRAPTKAAVLKHPNGAVAESLGSAWRLVLKSAEWKKLGQLAVANNSRIADLFLNSPVVPGEPDLWKDIRVADLKRRHVKGLLADRADTPHAAKNLLTTIRKMILVALDEEWIETDPTYRIKWRPAYKGFRAWTFAEMEAFEKRWKIGTTPRLVYSLALWLGNRRSNVVGLRWDQRTTRRIVLNGEHRDVDGFDLSYRKTDKQLFLPITPMLDEVLAATERQGETVLVTAYGDPFSPKSITGRMLDWTKAAGLSGCTLHGLRKTLGKLLAEGGASTRQLMDVLGHDDIVHAELYSREAEQVRLATEGMDRVVALVRRK